MFLYGYPYKGPTVHLGMFNYVDHLPGYPTDIPKQVLGPVLNQMVRELAMNFPALVSQGRSGLRASLDKFGFDEDVEDAVIQLSEPLADYMRRKHAVWCQIDDFDCLESSSSPDNWYVCTDTAIYKVGATSSVRSVRMLRHMMLLGLLGQYYQTSWRRPMIGVIDLSEKARWVSRMTDRYRNVSYANRQGELFRMPLANIPHSVIDGLQDWVNSSSYKLKIK